MRGKAEAAATVVPPPVVPAVRLAPTEATRCWAALWQQIVEVDPLAYPTCRGPMRLVAFITQPSVIDQILTHLRTRASAARGPAGPLSLTTTLPHVRGPSVRAMVLPGPQIGPRRHRPTETAVGTARHGAAVRTAHEACQRGGAHGR